MGYICTKPCNKQGIYSIQHIANYAFLRCRIKLIQILSLAIANFTRMAV